MKPTRWLSSSPCLLQRLGKKCPRNRSHRHALLLGKERTTAAAVYPPALCRSILIGIQEEALREAKSMEAFSLEGQYCQVQPEADHDPFDDWAADESPESQSWIRHDGRNGYYHTVTGDILPEDLTRQAREEEIRAMEEWQIGEIRPVSEAWRSSGKAPIRGKWVDHNKGDSDQPVIRSRYVACEVNTHKDDSLFAATPPHRGLTVLVITDCHAV